MPQPKKTFDAFAIDYSYKIEKKSIVMGGQSFTYLVKNHFKNKKTSFSLYGCLNTLELPL